MLLWIPAKLSVSVEKMALLQHHNILLGLSLVSSYCSNNTLTSTAFPSTKYVPRYYEILLSDSQPPTHCDETANKFPNNIQFAICNHDKRRKKPPNNWYSNMCCHKMCIKTSLLGFVIALQSRQNKRPLPQWVWASLWTPGTVSHPGLALNHGSAGLDP